MAGATRRRRWTIALSALAGAMGVGAACPADIVSAASDEHLWFVLERNQPRPQVELCHQAPSMGLEAYRAHMVLSSSPVAIAAWSDRLWLVNGPTTQDSRSQRSVFTVQVLFNEALDVYHTEPRERLRVVDPLPGVGRLAALVGTADGPVVLLVPRRLAEDPGKTTQMPEREAAMLPAPRLLRLHEGTWQDLALPDDLPSETRLDLAAAGSGGRRLTLLASDDENDRTVMFIRGEDGEWSRSPIDVPFRGIVATARVGEAVVLATGGSDPQHLELSYLLGRTTHGIGSVNRPPHEWALLGLADGMRLLARTANGELTIRSIDLLNERVEPFVALRPRPPTSGKVWAMSVLFAVALTAVILVLFIRPRREEVTLPADMQVLPVLPRVGGLLMDLAPAAVVTMLLFRCGVRDLLMLPIVTVDIEQTYPYFTMAAIALAHTSLSEVLTRRSLGKWLLNAGLVTCNGSRPPALRVLLRSLVTALLYLIPPLVVLGMLSPYLQGIHDQLSRIVVVRRLEEEEAKAPDDR